MDPQFVEGDREDYLARSARGECGRRVGQLLEALGVGVGDTLTLDSPTGPVSLPVLATIRDYTSDHGTIWMDRSVYVSRWKDEGIDMLDILLEKGADQAQVAAAIRASLADRTNRLFIMTSGEFKKIITRILDQFFSLAYIQLVIALVVAVLGVANTLVISVSERRRELGILKALGTARRQIVTLIVAEAWASRRAEVARYALGSYLVKFSVESVSAMFSGWTLPMRSRGESRPASRRC